MTETTQDDLSTGNAPESGGWRFDDSVTDAFDSMLERSIPMYDVMRKAVTDCACWFVEDHPDVSRVVDLGSSRGSALAPIIERLDDAATYHAYEISGPMLDVLNERFAERIARSPTARGRVEVTPHDLRDGFPKHQLPANAILSILTLQFVPIEHRQRIIQGIHDRLVSGGGFIWVEKVLGATAKLDSLEVDLYYGLKRDAGYTQEAIDRKRLSLEGVLVPLTASFNEDLLRQAGFRQIDVVWSWMNFRCWVAIRG